MKYTMLMLPQPGIMLLSGILIIAVLFWIIWPKRGLLAIIARGKRNNQRVQLEDALKYLFDCEYRDNPCDMNGMAGNVNISVDKASKLIEKLLSLELITQQNNHLLLTDTGRSYALRIIRVHRIWERYLADETSTSQADWHNEADRLEHRVTLEDTEKIAAQMGNPVFDPHGDPIPSSEGEIPQPKGMALSKLNEGEMGKIIHMEDEPRSIYEQLVVEGLYPGMQIYVTDVAENKITFAADGDERTLTPLFASHITVELFSGKTPVKLKYELLSSLEIGEEAEVAGISPNCRGQQRRRLMDLGIIPGSKVTAAMKSASGDPVGYRVMGTTVGIRRKQADLVFINRKNEHHEYIK